MQRIGYILTPETVTQELCQKAIIDASIGKRHRPAVQLIMNNLSTWAANLRKIILDGTYKPSPLKICHIVDIPSKKKRTLEKPKFYPDQCIHHAAILLVEQRLLKRLDPYCICGIKGRGTAYGHKAIKRWLHNDRKHTKYCLQGDVRKCYESIKPDIVVASMAKFIKDPKYLDLVKRIAYSYRSLPLGNYTSTWFCNLILLPLDQVCRQSPGCYHYVRYADDFIVLGPNKRELHKLVPEVEQTLASLGLALKPNWQVYVVDKRGIDFLGFRFFRSHTLLRKRNILSTTRAIRKWEKHKSAYLARGLLSRLGQLKHFNSYNYKKLYAKKLNIKQIKEVANRGLCRSLPGKRRGNF